VIFTTFGEKGLRKITTKSSADVIKSWKESYEIRKAYQEFNDDHFSSQIFQRSWSKRPSDEQLAFTISVIKYTFNPNIYSIQIQDEYIRRYMKKALEEMNAGEKIKFLVEEFEEQEKVGEEEEEEEEETGREEREGREDEGERGKEREEVVAEGSTIR